MKRFLITTALAAVALTASAQDNYKFTIKAGAGLASVVGADADSNFKLAAKAGVSFDVKLYKGLYFIPEIDFILKGFDTKHSFTLARISYSTPIHMTYLQAPIMVAYKFTMKEKGNVVLKVGPYFACGLFGSKASISGWGYYKEGWGYNKEVDVFDSVYGFRRFDAGINAGLAFERNHLAVGFEYSRGLYKLYPDLSQYNQSFGITLGFRI